MIAFGFFVLSTIFAIIREFYLFELFRLFEHLSILAAGAILAYTCYYGHNYLYNAEVK
ncbi:MAG: hypothetical protein U9Q22_02695 [Candidatus Altiarchaeota archaeon]|nr:hypothetical protein [Candidatus Altiarchaeota archaeon]